MYSEIKTITPKEAGFLLELNKRNRAVDHRKVSFYAEIVVVIIAIFIFFGIDW